MPDIVVCELIPNPRGRLGGHPLGALGGRIRATLAHAREHREARYAFKTMCIGGGRGLSGILSRGAS